MALNFPNNPTANQVYSLGDKTWKWNGYGWKLEKSESYSNTELSVFSTTGDGVTSTFSLGFSPLSSSTIFVTIGGIVQTENDYTVTTTNNTISFAEPPPASENIRAVSYKTIVPYYQDVANSVGAIVNSYNGVGDGSTTSFSLGFNPYTANAVFVTVGGIVQPDSAYSVSNVNNSISFSTAPGLNENIRVTGFSRVNPFITYYANQNVSVSIFETTANGLTDTYALGFNPQSAETLLVTIDGVVQPITTYSVNTTANTITFSETPLSGEAVRVATFYTAVNTVAIQLAASNVTIKSFETTANGTVNTYDLGFNPLSNLALIVSIDGVVQAPSTYTINTLANTISFLSTPQNNEYISVTTLTNATNTYIVDDNTITFNKLQTSVRAQINSAFDTANASFNTANASFVTANAAATTGKAIAMSIVFGG